jgi:hypothetical protein
MMSRELAAEISSPHHDASVKKRKLKKKKLKYCLGRR